MSKNIIESLRSDLSQKFHVNFDYSYANGNTVMHVPKDYVNPVLTHFKRTNRFDF